MVRSRTVSARVCGEGPDSYVEVVSLAVRDFERLLSDQTLLQQAVQCLSSSDSFGAGMHSTDIARLLLHAEPMILGPNELVVHGDRDARKRVAKPGFGAEGIAESRGKPMASMETARSRASIISGIVAKHVIWP